MARTNPRILTRVARNRLRDQRHNSDIEFDASYANRVTILHLTEYAACRINGAVIRHGRNALQISDMAKTYLWQDPAFPHFYSYPAVVAPLEASFKQAVTALDARISKQNVGFADVLTEEIVSNSEIEGVLLDRESVHSSFVENIIPAREKERGAVQLTRMALKHPGELLSHDLLFEMHRAVLLGASGFPEESIGAYVGDMKIVSGTRIDREQTVILKCSTA